MQTKTLLSDPSYSVQQCGRAITPVINAENQSEHAMLLG
jgi:hypothetical protein